jgi:hypothetical protein
MLPVLQINIDFRELLFNENNLNGCLMPECFIMHLWEFDNTQTLARMA